jgi:hypothetical protein
VPIKALQNLFLFQRQRLQWSNILSSKSWFFKKFIYYQTRNPPYTKHLISSCSFIHQIPKKFANKCSFELPNQRNNVWGFDLVWVLKCSITSLSTVYHSAFFRFSNRVLNNCFYFSSTWRVSKKNKIQFMKSQQ